MATGAAQAPWLAWLADRGLAVLATAGALLLLLLVWSAVLGRRLRRVQDRFNRLAGPRDGATLDAALDRHLARIDGAEAEVRALRAEVRRLREAGRRHLQHVGLVRFDAFDGVSGQVSFALAVVDDQRDGFVLNSLFARDGSSVYAKPIRAGESEIPLGEEEREALAQALARAGTA